MTDIPHLAVGPFSLGFEGHPELLIARQGLLLPKPDIYTLEGPNQSGKSVFVHFLTGTLPRLLTSISPNIVVSGRPVQINHYSDALQAGIVAVFQDDDLIPSMTVYDNLLLRHSTIKPGDFASYGYTLAYNYSLHHLVAPFEHSNIPRAVSRIIDMVKPKGVDWGQRDNIRAKAEERLRRYGEKFVAILDRTPDRLSGGARAIAKIVAAQLHENIRVLILDEAFNGLQRDLWPFVLGEIRAWQQQKHAAVLAISHNADEIARWEPLQRFEIRERELSAAGNVPRGAVRRGVPARNSVFPICVRDAASLDTQVYQEFWAAFGMLREFVVLTSSMLRNHPATQELLKYVPAGSQIRIVEAEVSEEDDHTELYVRLLASIIKISPASNVGVVIVGGGLMLNFGGFVAATLNRGKAPIGLVPTTLLAMADVAVGSKTSINLDMSKFGKVPAPLNVKHTVGVYHNPSVAFLNSGYLTKLPIRERKIGLIECLKHGITQDAELYSCTKALLLETEPDITQCFNAAIRTMNLKSECLELDPWEEGYSRILLYGHLHGHCIERITSMKIPHGTAILIGMLLEQILSGGTAIRDDLIHIISNWKVTLDKSISTLDFDLLKEVYFSDNKAVFHRGDHFVSLRVQDAGVFGLDKIRTTMESEGKSGWVAFADYCAQKVKSAEFEVTWEEIRSAYRQIEGLLRA
jgi:3-dehydroquinate synthetase/ABC-type branched-subunit amino acid transport system ATPase component